MLVAQLFVIEPVQQAVPAPLQPAPPHCLQSAVQQYSGVVSVVDVAAITPALHVGSIILQGAGNSAHDRVMLPVRHSAGTPLPPHFVQVLGQQELPLAEGTPQAQLGSGRKHGGPNSRHERVPVTIGPARHSEGTPEPPHTVHDFGQQAERAEGVPVEQVGSSW